MIIDHNAACTRLSQAEVSKVILKRLYERVSMHLGDHDDVSIMIADKPGGGAKEEKRWLADTLDLTSDGTEYVQPGRVVLPVVTADSRHVPHLQLADLIAAATTGAIAGIPPALELGPLLARLMHRRPRAPGCPRPSAGARQGLRTGYRRPPSWLPSGDGTQVETIREDRHDIRNRTPGIPAGVSQTSAHNKAGTRAAAAVSPSGTAAGR